MNARMNALRRPQSALVVLVCLTAALLALSSPALAIKRGTESVNCGGAASQSPSYKAHDTIAQCPIGPVGEGTHTFYLNAKELTGECRIGARQFNVLYFPTALGTVDTTE